MMECQNLFSHLPKITKDNRLIWFQYRILHNNLTTNRTVAKFKIDQTEYCSFCDKHPEYITHLFYECEVIKRFWRTLHTLVSKRCEITIPEFSKKLIILNCTENVDVDSITKLLILMGKYHIYRCKTQGAKPSVNMFIKEVERVYKLEEEEVKGNACHAMMKFDLKWLNYKRLFMGLVTSTL